MRSRSWDCRRILHSSFRLVHSWDIRLAPTLLVCCADKRRVHMSEDTYMSDKLADAALDQLFREARTYNAFLPKEVTDEQLHALYDLAKFGPTSANCSPMRVV